MKKGPLHFLGRKNQSLFDTNVDINKDLGNVELVLDSAAIPESGTAKVRSRPTVKHFMSSESLQGFAVPTPKVPVLPPFNEPKINGTGSTTNLPNGGMMSVPDLIEGEILIPPPPSSAPPPPPSFAAPSPPSFVPPPPKVYAQLDSSVDHASPRPPPMAPPKPPSHISSEYSSNLDLAYLKPPPMAPPKPPSETSSLRGSVSSLDVQDIPECPKFTPPPPPVVKTPPVIAKAQKSVPPKPFRMSSIPNLEIQPQRPESPLASNPTPSSFNPQNTAKLYNVQKSTLLDGQMDREKGVKSILLLEDSTGNTVVVNGNGGKNPGPGVPPVKPARRNSSATQLVDDHPEKTQVPSEPPKVEAKIETEPAPNINTEVPAPIKISPKIEKRIPDVRQVMAPVESPGRSRRFSPVINHRQLNTRRADSPGKKETSASPFALLMAAKEREKQRTALSRQNSSSGEPVNAVIQPSEEKPNSFTVIPRDPKPEIPRAQLKTNTQPLTSTKDETPKVSNSKLELSPMKSSVGSVPVRDAGSQEDSIFIPPPPEFANSDTEDDPPVPPPSQPAPAPPVKTSPLPPTPATTNFSLPSQSSPAPPPIKPFVPSTSIPVTNSSPPSQPAPVPPVKTSPPLPTHAPVTNLSPPSQSTPVPPPVKPSTSAPLTNSTPPSNPAPATPPKYAHLPAQLVLPTPITNSFPISHSAPSPPPSKPSLPPTPPPVTNGPLVSPKPKPPVAPPKAPGPPPNLQLQSRPPSQTKPTQVPPSVASNQATLLSILQKKMLEMDPKLAAKQLESNGDDWNSPLSDDEATSPPAVYNPNKTRSATLPAQSHGLDMKELESKAARKAQDIKSHNSTGKQQYGMTFTVRPGSKQPITPVIKDGSA